MLLAHVMKTSFIMPSCLLVCCFLCFLTITNGNSDAMNSRLDALAAKCSFPDFGIVNCSHISFNDGLPSNEKLALLYHETFTNCSINQVPKDYFDPFRFIAVLVLNVNNITHLDEDVFSPCKRLQMLSLEQNMIEELPEGIFRELKRLEFLELGYNRITSLPEKIFRGLKNLEILRLNDNRLVSLEATLFKGLNLSFVSLSKNRLINLPATVFQGLHRLEMAIFNGNQLYILPNGLFDNLPCLIGADVSDNDLIDSGSLAMKRSPQIQFLSFPNNKMLQITPLADLNNLQALLLQNNRIFIIKSNSFVNLPKLLIINLSENRIITVERNSFVNVPSLKHLFLSNNRIIQMSGLFCVNTSFVTLSLTNNPIKLFDSSFFQNSSLEFLFTENTNIGEFQLFKPKTALSSQKTEIYLNTTSVQASFRIEKLNNITDMLRLLAYSGINCHKDGNCTNCPLGTFAIAPTLMTLDLKCYNCPAGGFFQDNIGHVALNYNIYKGCKTCPRGTYVSLENAPGKSSFDCKKCPSGTKFSNFAGFRACKCLPGFYRTDGFGPCLKCPNDGVVCRIELIFLKPGFFWAWESNVRKEAFRKFAKNLEVEDETYDIKYAKYIGQLPPAYPCPVQEACKGSIISDCAEGYTGVLCNLCAEGFYKGASLGCQKCSIGWISVQAVIILFLTILIITLVRKKKRKDKSRSLSDILMSQIKILIGFYQVSLGIMQSFSFIDWPQNLDKYVEYANILQLNLFLVLPLPCILPGFQLNPFYKMVISVLGNVFVILLSSIIYYFRKSRINKKDLSDQQKTAAISSAKETNYRFIIFFMFLTFPTTCTSIISVMPAACQEICSENSCTWYLKADYRVKCYDNYYYRWLKVAWLAVLYPVVLLVITVMLLWKCSRKTKVNAGQNPSHNKELRLASSFLFENYSRKFWYWEVVETTRKLILSSGMFLISNGSRIHIIIAASMSIVYALLFAFIKPMRHAFDNVVQLTSLTATFVNFALVALLRVSKESSENAFGDIKEDEDIVSIFLIVTNALLLILINWNSFWLLYPNIKAWFLNPKFSLECCLATLVSFTDATSNFTDANPVGNLELPSIQDTLNDQLTLEIKGFEKTEEQEMDKVSKTSIQKFLKKRAWGPKTEED